ncbi:putative nicotinate phosphoribosyltransferase [Dioscorea sansibarensis]
MILKIFLIRTTLYASFFKDEFFDYFREIDCSDVEVYAISKGSVVYPKVPLMRIERPVAVVHILEPPFINLVNYASLVTTNAARHRFVSRKLKNLLEFGLRRAQGPDGGISASRYCYMGRFDTTRSIMLKCKCFKYGLMILITS